jgi:hypothetical protein
MYIMIHVCHHSSVHAHVGPEPSSAQKRRRLQTDEELADYRQLRKLFKLKKGVNASDVLAPLVEIAPLVCPALHDPATHAPLWSSPRLVEAPGQSRSTGGPVEAQVFKREAAAQMAMEVCGSSQRAAMALVLGFIATTGQALPMKYIMSVSQIDDHVASRVHLTRSKLIARTGATHATSARWAAASSAVTVASTRPTPSVPSWASR